MKAFSQKLSEAVWLVGIDWTGKLPTGVTMVGASVTAEFHPYSANQIGDPASILSGTPTFNDYQIVQKIAGGTPGWKIVLTFTPTLSDGQIDPEQASVTIVDIQT